MIPVPYTDLHKLDIDLNFQDIYKILSKSRHIVRLPRHEPGKKNRNDLTYYNVFEVLW